MATLCMLDLKGDVALLFSRLPEVDEATWPDNKHDYKGLEADDSMDCSSPEQDADPTTCNLNV